MNSLIKPVIYYLRVLTYIIITNIYNYKIASFLLLVYVTMVIIVVNN